MKNGKPKKRIRRRPGDIVAIRLDDGFYCFARVLPEAVLAFYDRKQSTIPKLDEILSFPILFKIPVMRSAITSGRWQVIGNHPLESELLEHPRYFIKDMLTGKFRIYQGGIETPATREEVEGLERASVWSAEHIEERLRDHYAGVPNKWVEMEKPDWKFVPPSERK